MSACDLKGFCSVKKKSTTFRTGVQKVKGSTTGKKQDTACTTNCAKSVGGTVKKGGLRIRQQVRDFSDFSSSESDDTDNSYSDSSDVTESDESDSSFDSSGSSFWCCSCSDSCDSSDSDVSGYCHPRRKQRLSSPGKFSRATPPSFRKTSGSSSFRACPSACGAGRNKASYETCTRQKKPQSKKKPVVKKCSVKNDNECEAPRKKPKTSSSARKSKSSKNSPNEGNRASRGVKTKKIDSSRPKTGASSCSSQSCQAKKPTRKTSIRGSCSTGVRPRRLRSSQ